MPLSAKSDGRDTLGLVPLCQRFVDELWIPAHYTPEQAAEFALDQFRRTVRAEIEMVEVVAEPNEKTQST